MFCGLMLLYLSYINKSSIVVENNKYGTNYKQ